MNIVGDYAVYINTLLMLYAPADVEDMRGIINNGTLYFIVNHGILYEINLPNIPNDICCAFFRYKDVPGSFSQEGIIQDIPEIFPEVANKIMVLAYANNNPIYIEDDVRCNDQFETIENMRPIDGCYRFNIYSNMNHKSFVTLSKKMFKLNKADTLSLEVYPVDINRLLYKFKIYKKKFNLNINLYLLTMDLH